MGYPSGDLGVGTKGRARTPGKQVKRAQGQKGVENGYQNPLNCVCLEHPAPSSEIRCKELTYGGQPTLSPHFRKTEVGVKD